MLRRIFCLFGLHSRGALIQRQPGIYYRSVCKGCHQPIVRRTGERHWRIDPEITRGRQSMSDERRSKLSH